MKHVALSIALGLMLTGCATTHRAPEFLAPAADAARPLSPAVRANGFLFLAGQLGTDSTGKLVPGGIQAETRQAMTKIAAILQRNGSSLERVVKCTVYLIDMQEWAAMNEVYVTFFPAGRRPARTAVGISGLVGDARVEIECLAAD
jgi:reactive intermediate/imine deaminase